MRWAWSCLLCFVCVSRAAAGEPETLSKLLPAPWVEGEASWFVTEFKRTRVMVSTRVTGLLPSPTAGDGTPAPRPTPFPTPMVVGTTILVAQPADPGRVRLETYEIAATVRSSGFASSSGSLKSIEADRETLAAHLYSRRSFGSEGEYLARFSGGRVEATSRSGAVRMYDLEDARFDQSELPFVVRRLPLELGRSLRFSVFAGGPGVYPVTVTVVGRETITVPAGTFDCLKVEVKEDRHLGAREMTGGSPPVGPSTAQQQQYWISTDARRQLVKYTDENGANELARVTAWGEAVPLAFDSSGWKVSLRAPAGWIALPSRVDRDWAFSVPLMSADVRVVCTAHFENFLLILKEPPATRPVGWRPEPPRRFLERELKSRTRILTAAFAVREDGWKDLTHDGSPATRYVADYQERPEQPELVEYGMALTDPVRAHLACITPKTDFEARKPEIEALMDSLRLR